VPVLSASLLAVLVASVLLAGAARRFDISAPLALVVAGLAASALPGLHDIRLESFAFLLIGLQLPSVAREMAGIRASAMVLSSVAVLATVVVVRVAWIYLVAYLPRLLSARSRARGPAPKPSYLFVVAWAGMRGVVSLAAAFAVPLTTLSSDPFPGRPQLVFLTFVVVIGTLLLHGLTLPWVIKVLKVHGDDAGADALAVAAAQERAAHAAAVRLDELLAGQRAEDATDAQEQAAAVLRAWSNRRRSFALKKLDPDKLDPAKLDPGEVDVGESAPAAFRRLRLEMLAAERDSFIEERDAGHIDDEALRSLLHGLDLEEATLNRGYP